MGFGARAGLRPWHVLRLVIIPQALKPMLAPYVTSRSRS